jgi:hypothetical protein
MLGGSLFITKAEILGHHRNEEGIRSSEDNFRQFRDWPIPMDKDLLMRFFNTLVCFQKLIPGRADSSRILKTAIVEETIVMRRNGKQIGPKKRENFV